MGHQHFQHPRRDQFKGSICWSKIQPHLWSYTTQQGHHAAKDQPHKEPKRTSTDISMLTIGNLPFLKRNQTFRMMFSSAVTLRIGYYTRWGLQEGNSCALRSSSRLYQHRRNTSILACQQPASR